MQARRRRMVLVGYVHWIIIIVNIRFELMGFSKLPIFLLLLCLTYNQSPCYVSCSNGGCLSSNALACTRCDVGTVLINQRCAIAGSQSVTSTSCRNPSKYLPPTPSMSLMLPLCSPLTIPRVNKSGVLQPLLAKLPS